MIKKRIFLIACISACFCSQSYAQSATQKTIHWIDQKIAAAKSHLAHIKQHRSDIQDNLKDIEIHISRLITQKALTQKQLSTAKNTIAKVKKTIQKTEASLKTNQQQLANLIKIEYQLGKQSNMQLALNNESIATKQRLTSYLNIINQKQVAIANAIKQQLQNLTIQKQNLMANQKNYQAILVTITKNQKMLELAINHRLQIMKHMTKSIASHTAQLSALLKQKRSLTKAIAQANQDIPVTDHFNFTYNFKYPMYWPTRGALSQLFGTRIDHSQLTTDGVVINAPIGQSIYAIANGVVVFSKWLPGYGLLMIINHGHGYMSLYGRCQQLFYHNGQTIKKGAIIATVGNTGGFAKSGLYFAIRHHGIPVNPKHYMI